MISIQHYIKEIKYSTHAEKELYLSTIKTSLTYKNRTIQETYDLYQKIHYLVNKFKEGDKLAGCALYACFYYKLRKVIYACFGYFSIAIEDIESITYVSFLDFIHLYNKDKSPLDFIRHVKRLETIVHINSVH